MPRKAAGTTKGTSNKTSGNKFEAEFCQFLFEHGFWSHNMAQNSAGQPADVIAVKDGKGYLIDCKVCDKNEFKLDRIEPNQDSAMKLWEMVGNGIGWFALKIDDGIYMINYPNMIYWQKRQSNFNKDEIKSIGIPLREWIKSC